MVEGTVQHSGTTLLTVGGPRRRENLHHNGDIVPCAADDRCELIHDTPPPPPHSRSHNCGSSRRHLHGLCGLKKQQFSTTITSSEFTTSENGTECKRMMVEKLTRASLASSLKTTRRPYAWIFEEVFHRAVIWRFAQRRSCVAALTPCCRSFARVSRFRVYNNINLCSAVSVFQDPIQISVYSIGGCAYAEGGKLIVITYRW